MNLTNLIELAERGLVLDFFIRRASEASAARGSQCLSEDCEANAELAEKYLEESDIPHGGDDRESQRAALRGTRLLYRVVLGKNLKYSRFFERTKLTDAEDKALDPTCKGPARTASDPGTRMRMGSSHPDGSGLSECPHYLRFNPTPARLHRAGP